MGPLVFIPFDNDPRRSPPIPRDSKTFKELYNQRTASERFFSQLRTKELKQRLHRRRYINQIRLSTYAFGCHGRAWALARFALGKLNTAEQVLDAIRQLRDDWEEKLKALAAAEEQAAQMPAFGPAIALSDPADTAPCTSPAPDLEAAAMPVSDVCSGVLP